jgi:replication factor A1
VFNEQAEKILGMSANELNSIKDTDQYSRVFEKACFQEFVLRCRVKQEVYNDENRVRVSCVSLDPAGADECKTMLQLVENMC